MYTVCFAFVDTGRKSLQETIPKKPNWVPSLPPVPAGGDCSVMLVLHVGGVLPSLQSTFNPVISCDHVVREAGLVTNFCFVQLGRRPGLQLAAVPPLAMGDLDGKCPQSGTHTGPWRDISQDSLKPL